MNHLLSASLEQKEKSPGNNRHPICAFAHPARSEPAFRSQMKRMASPPADFVKPHDPGTGDAETPVCVSPTSREALCR
jgi:hypothetical protein